MFFHGGIQLLGQVIGYIGHAGLLLVGAANAAFVFVGLLIVLFLGILAVTLTALEPHAKLSEQHPFPRLWAPETPYAPRPHTATRGIRMESSKPVWLFYVLLLLQDVNSESKLSFKRKFSTTPQNSTGHAQCLVLCLGKACSPV